jgi:hypothetical protein
MKNLKHIFATYPDATIIQLHPQTTNSKLAVEMADAIDSINKFRASHPDLHSKFIDVKYPS